jgi:protein-tyrosine kinase
MNRSSLTKGPYMNTPTAPVSLTDVLSSKGTQGIARARALPAPDAVEGHARAPLLRPVEHSRSYRDGVLPTFAEDNDGSMSLLRTQLALRWFNDPQHRALAIVSADARDERSTIAARLAIACARAGDRTLLIDADLRTPSAHSLFGMSTGAGVASVLAGEENLRDCVLASSLDGLSILCSGPMRESPAESPAQSAAQSADESAGKSPDNLLTKARLSQLLEHAARDFDVILIDTPNLLAFPDARSIAAATGGALATVRRNQTPVRALLSLATELRGIGVTIVGSVFIEP